MPQFYIVTSVKIVSPAAENLRLIGGFRNSTITEITQGDDFAIFAEDLDDAIGKVSAEIRVALDRIRDRGR